MSISVLSEKIQFKLGYYDPAASLLLKSGGQKARDICAEIARKGGKPRLVLEPWDFLRACPHLRMLRPCALNAIFQDVNVAGGRARTC